MRIVSAAGTIFEGEAERMVELPSVKGRMQVLHNHAPLLAALDKGVVKVDERAIEITGGLARVEKNNITVLC